MCREDFYRAGVKIDVHDNGFRDTVQRWARDHRTDLIVMDNLAHLIGAEYNDSKRVHGLMTFAFQLTEDHNAAVILAAHPRKQNDESPVRLGTDPSRFFESIMGSSHFINSTGSLWGLERVQESDYSVFVGGRQRGEGHQAHSYLSMRDDGWFYVVDDAAKNLSLVVNTEVRRRAWQMLPAHPLTFGYRDGESTVRSAMKSSSSYSQWLRECRRLKVIVDAPDGKLRKAPGLAVA